MSLMVCGQFLRRYAVLLAVSLVLGAVAGVAVSRVTVTRYTATATVMISMADRQDDPGGYHAVAFLMSRTPEYGRIASSDSFISYAIDSYQLDVSEADLRRDLEVVSPKDSGLVGLQVQGPTAELAVYWVNSLAMSLARIIPTRENLLPVRASVVDRAAPNSVTADSMSPLEGAAYAVVGVTLGLVVAAGRELHRRPPRRPAASDERPTPPVLAHSLAHSGVPS